MRFHIKPKLISLLTSILLKNKSDFQKTHLLPSTLLPYLLHEFNLQYMLLAGDVVLNRLVLKQSALDELDLPVKTVAGHIGESHCFLVLKSCFNYSQIFTIII